jgi:hypothetical protein
MSSICPPRSFPGESFLGPRIIDDSAPLLSGRIVSLGGLWDELLLKVAGLGVGVDVEDCAMLGGDAVNVLLMDGVGGDNRARDGEEA